MQRGGKKKRKQVAQHGGYQGIARLFRPMPKMFLSTLEGDLGRDFASFGSHGLEVGDVGVGVHLEDDVATLAHVHVCGHRSEVSIKSEWGLGEADHQSYAGPRLANKGEASTVGGDKDAVGECIWSKNGSVRCLLKGQWSCQVN